MSKTTMEQDSGITRTLRLDRSAAGRHRLGRWLGWGLAIAGTAIAVVAWLTRDSDGTLQFRTQEAERGSLTVIVTATGTLQPTNQVDVGIEVSGTVASVEVDYNDRVQHGQVLAKLDTSKFEAQVLKSKASLASAQAKVLQTQATVKEARNELARLEQVRKLSEGKVPSQHDLDAAVATLQRARADEASARASVSEAQATLEVNETDLSKAVIHSPINGVVLSRTVEPGQTVAASFQAPVLFTLAEDLTKMELHVDVDEADVGHVQDGQEATFTVDAYPDRTFPARITQVRYGAQTVEGVVTYQTVLDVNNSDLSLRPGMTATAEITVERIENAILVFNAALRFAPPVQEEQPAGGGGTLLSRLFPRPSRTTAKRRNGSTTDDKSRRVWTLRDGQPVAVPISAGATDGVMTEVKGGAVEPGMALLVDTVGSTR